jgi:hypothetical protein
MVLIVHHYLCVLDFGVSNWPQVTKSHYHLLPIKFLYFFLKIKICSHMVFNSSSLFMCFGFWCFKLAPKLLNLTITDYLSNFILF